MCHSWHLSAGRCLIYCIVWIWVQTLHTLAHIHTHVHTYHPPPHTHPHTQFTCTSFPGLSDSVRMPIWLCGGGRPCSLTFWPWCCRLASQSCTPLTTSTTSGMPLYWEWQRKKLRSISTQSFRKQGEMPGALVLTGTFMDWQRTIEHRWLESSMCVYTVMTQFLYL